MVRVGVGVRVRVRVGARDRVRVSYLWDSFSVLLRPQHHSMLTTHGRKLSEPFFDTTVGPNLARMCG